MVVVVIKVVVVQVQVHLVAEPQALVHGGLDHHQGERHQVPPLGVAHLLAG